VRDGLAEILARPQTRETAVTRFTDDLPASVSDYGLATKQPDSRRDGLLTGTKLCMDRRRAELHWCNTTKHEETMIPTRSRGDRDWFTFA
jgi:hypothetical protein